MNITVKPLSPELTTDYLGFFANRAFKDDDPNGPCFCTCPTQSSFEIDRMVGEFGSDIKTTLRRYAGQMLAEGRIHGYLAYDGDAVIGWCNAGDMDSYTPNRYQFVPDFARGITVGKTLSIVCFAISPGYRGKGFATLLLALLLRDAASRGFVAAEGYAHIGRERDGFDFKGPENLYIKAGFTEAARENGVAVMRKIL